MSTLVDDAVDILRDLPGDAQARAAQAIIDFAAGLDELALSDEQAAEIERRMANPNRTFLSLDETRHRLRRFGV